MNEQYDSYKDSGVAWIGQVPQGWEVRRLKRVCQIYGRIGFRGYNQSDLVGEGEGAITLSPSNMKDGKMDYAKCSYLSWGKYYESPEIMIENGDILFVKTGSTYGKVAFVSDLPMEATINPQIVVLKSINCDTTFFMYVLSSELIQNQVNTSVIGGTIPTISQEKILSYKLPLPPLPEQRAIAGYLDARCAAIDAYVASLEREAGLARELKQAVIARAVTRGLDPNTPMRDSGIPWIGQVPEGWECVKIRRICRLKTGTTPSTDVREWFDGTLTWFTPSDFKNDYVLEHSLRTLSAKAKEDRVAVIVPANTVLIIGIGATAGKVGMCMCESSFNQQITALLPMEEMRPKYLLYRMIGIGKYMKETSASTTLPILNNQTIGDTYITYPPLPIQRAIAGYLDARCAAIDAYVANLEREAALARELKAREIADAVTGKVKITG